MPLQVIKSTPKTFQYGVIAPDGSFYGVTLKGDNLVYDPVTGLPVSGTVKWMEYENHYATEVGDNGSYVVSNLTEATVADLFAAEANWYVWDGFERFVQSTDGATIDLGLQYYGRFSATSGDDVITGTVNYIPYRIDGMDGNDHMTGSDWTDSLIGGSGHDSLFGGGSSDTLEGGTGNDVLFGGTHDDSLYGGDGNDTLNGGAGHDLILGDEQYYDNEVEGFIGADILKGGGGNDIIFGHGGADKLYGELGADTLSGGSGNDTLYGGDGNDQLILGDNIFFLGGDDHAYGGAGDDLIAAGPGNSFIYGGTGHDGLVSTYGNDVIRGGDGDDYISTQNGGIDRLAGGAGADRFVFHIPTHEHATVFDFDPTVDTISLGYETDMTAQQQYEVFLAGAVQTNQHLVWTEGTAQIMFKRTDLDDLTADHFVDVPGFILAEY